jgi:inositol transport system permease protein
VYAIGGNPEAARLAGVNVKRVLVSVYVLIGCLAGLAGFILSARGECGSGGRDLI